MKILFMSQSIFVRILKIEYTLQIEFYCINKITRYRFNTRERAT